MFSATEDDNRWSAGTETRTIMDAELEKLVFCNFMKTVKKYDDDATEPGKQSKEMRRIATLLVVQHAVYCIPRKVNYRALLCVSVFFLFVSHIVLR